jgi:hypothetical protein
MALRFFSESRWLSKCSILANLNRKPPKTNTVGAVLKLPQDEHSKWRSKFELHPKAAESENTELR